MIADLVIRGGRLVTGDGETRRALAIHHGRIVAVDRDDAMPEAGETIDATHLHVLPGIIDTHVHLRDPGKIGYSIHAGMVVVADGTEDGARRLRRVLTTDPGTGIVRHADAGYALAREVARAQGIHMPMLEQEEHTGG